MSEELHKETRSIRIQTERSEQREHATPLFMTSSFVFEDAEQARAMFADEIQGNIYTRFSNPNTNEFVEKMCMLEELEDGVATASGMAAVFTSIAGLLRAGDHIVSSRAVFGSTHQILTQILPRWGITTTYVDPSDNEAWESAVRPETRMLFAETPSNPGLQLTDLEFLGQLAERRGLILNVDNCFATPYVQVPARFGAHIVTHSATKYIDGQGRAVGGVIVGRKDLIKEIRFFARQTGPSMSPFNAWIFSKSLETLSIRMDRHCDSALALAKWLQNHPEVDSVRYPFLDGYPQQDLARRQMAKGGGMVAFDIKGGLERGRSFLNALKLCSLTANLGDTRTIVTHPASTTHSKLSPEERQSVAIGDGLIRVSVGLEHIGDIIKDLDQAFG
jgi:O-succinylhomoserine sulfhydrylase